ncbi:hypothetical protein [Nocardioides sp.]|uniref:hypothetical protein n=1 Tax=Nocardioides sp. TaxID=35761 RepID=UPI0026104432|nr:hypothetical protein [Nocardioides sp.]
MHSRMFRNGVVTGTVTLALALGGVAVTGGAAQAAGSSADREVSSQCQQARKDLSKAKKQLRKAKRSDNAAKVRKAKKRVKAEKRDVRTACAPAPVTQETVLEQVQQGSLALDGIDLNGLTAVLPPEAAAAIQALIAQLQAGLDQVQGQAEVPGLDTAQLEALLAAVQAMDPAGVAAALQGLLGELTAIGGGPEAMATLIQLLQGGLPTGDLPIAGIPQLEDLIGQLTAQLGGLAGGGLPTDPAAVQAAIAQFIGTIEAISGNVGGDSAPWLGALTEMVDQLGALGALVPGGAGSGAILGQVISGLLFFAQPGVDPLGQLQGILAGPGGIGSVLDLLGLGDLLGGLLG